MFLIFCLLIYLTAYFYVFATVMLEITSVHKKSKLLLYVQYLCGCMYVIYFFHTGYVNSIKRNKAFLMNKPVDGAVKKIFCLLKVTVTAHF